MELGLSLGDASKPFAPFIAKPRDRRGFGFCMGLSIGPTLTTDGDADDEEEDRPLQLELLPNSSVPRCPNAFPWASSENGSSEADVKRVPTEEVSSPNSAASSFQKEIERGSSRASDEDDNGSNRKKLRLSKEQSAFLEESFKEHNTLNPKQKVALAKQLNLRPRQVEVWFQNRRARTKLKQTEVECEYLKRSCETLTEEKRRLQKEVQDLKALKATTPFHMQVPATTLTMCPSCERVAANSTDLKTSSNRHRFYPSRHA